MPDPTAQNAFLCRDLLDQPMAAQGASIRRESKSQPSGHWRFPDERPR
jgi:hypothetical protein